MAFFRSSLHLGTKKNHDHRFWNSLFVLFAVGVLVAGGCSGGSDGLDAEVARDADSLGGYLSQDVDPPEKLNRGPCMECSRNSDCLGDLTCHPLGEETFCFESCEHSDDCESGWMCYPTDITGYHCVPRQLECQLDCLIGGCPAQQTCNQVTGHCVPGNELCAGCDFDWDCAGDLRCHPKKSYCSPPCDLDEQCPAGFACQSIPDSSAEIQIRLCTSLYTECCVGESCEGLCLQETPFRVGGVCLECRSNEDCKGEGEDCKEDGSCGPNPCTHPYLRVEVDGECVECRVDEDCSSFGEDGTFWCEDNVCTNSSGVDNCEYCMAPYPACVEINGIWSCVQCTDDLDCDIGTCDTSLFGCVKTVENPGCVGCLDDVVCVSSTGMFDLKCDLASGCCFDSRGWCDGVESICPNGTCVGLADAMGSSNPFPGMPDEGAFGACSCENPLKGAEYLSCILGGCISEECPQDLLCVEPTILTDMTGGTPPETPGICLPLKTLTGISD